MQACTTTTRPRSTRSKFVGMCRRTRRARSKLDACYSRTTAMRPERYEGRASRKVGAASTPPSSHPWLVEAYRLREAKREAHRRERARDGADTMPIQNQTLDEDRGRLARDRKDQMPIVDAKTTLRELELMLAEKRATVSMSAYPGRIKTHPFRVRCRWDAPIAFHNTELIVSGEGHGATLDEALDAAYYSWSESAMEARRVEHQRQPTTREPLSTETDKGRV